MKLSSITISASIHIVIGISILAIVSEKAPSTETSSISTITINKYFEAPQEETPGVYEQPKEPIFTGVTENVEISEAEIEEPELTLPELPEPEVREPLNFHEIPLRVARLRRPRVPETAPTPPRPTPVSVASAPEPAPQALRPISMPRFYPPEAARSGISGTVYVFFVVAPDGTVASAQVLKSSGFRVLDDAAISSVLKWIFSPPGAFRKVRVPFTFKLV